jgi:hypothetical protein
MTRFKRLTLNAVNVEKLQIVRKPLSIYILLVQDSFTPVNPF